jgi:hypothetical protein
MKYNSQICTTREQSERLLALGLKSETADCTLAVGTENKYVPIAGIAFPRRHPEVIPAWSLHRLIELKQPNSIDNSVVVLSRVQTYDKLIGMIAKSIKEGIFPKEYLED